MHHLRTAVLATLAAVLALPIFGAAASAQTYRGPAPHYAVRHQSIDGIIVEAQPYHIAVRQGRRVWNVDLHNGTVIRPTGLTLRTGMRVRVDGYQKRDGNFEANRIDLQRRRR